MPAPAPAAPAADAAHMVNLRIATTSPGVLGAS